MLDIHELRRQHSLIMIQATGLRGLGDMIKTRHDAEEARAAIKGIDRMLIEHLTLEDDHLYPALLAGPDSEVAAMAADCAEEMGGIRGAWMAYRDQWTTAAIAADPARFSAATAGVIGALALRVERENTDLYPAFEALAQAPITALRAAG